FLHWFAHYKHDSDSPHSHSRSHSHPNTNNEHCHYTLVDIDADIEHSHLHHNHTHHNLHQHLNSPSIYSNAKSFFNNNNNSPPCTPSNEPNIITSQFIESNSKDRPSSDKSEQVSLTQKMFASQFSNEIDSIHPIIQQLK
ncbi:unnamed protein product, partial [Rotaria magnacalcarata]